MGSVPEQIGVYRLEREIGRGGMGVVYLARDTALDRPVAIKALPSDFIDDKKRMRRLLREAQLLASVNHPNIATIHHLERSGNARFLVLEYIEGDSLQERLASGPLPLVEGLEYARQIAAALEAAHERGVIHRDLKPSNIMVTPDRRIKVLDFGLAKSFAPHDRGGPGTAAATTAPHTREGDLLGTPGYMSPEQARGEAADKRTDIWSFGVILFEMLAGGPAFPGRSVHDAVAATLRDEPDYEDLPRRVPVRLVDLIRHCLRKDPESRLRDIGDARIELDDVLNDRRVPGGDSAAGREGPDNLPLELTTFIGRERELSEVERLIATARLLTLMGAGGCGKTRLAIQFGRRMKGQFPGGVWFVGLGGLTDSALVPHTVAHTLIPGEGGDGPPVERIVDALADQDTLLILDNCEHLLEGCARLMQTVLERCPRASVLTTSREALHLEGEQTFRVPSLSLPAALDVNASAIAACESVRLFVDRAQLTRPEFTLQDDTVAIVARICRRLDGIPLAIELAAARVRSLTLEQIVDRLDHRFRLLRGGSRTSVARHRTLRAVVDWSYQLLADAECTLLRRMAVFRGGWTLETAEGVSRDDGCASEEDIVELLTALVDKSLITFDAREPGEGRYRMPEMIREYALHRLDEEGEAERVRLRHLEQFLALGEAAEPSLAGGRDQARWLNRLAAEHDNIRAALEFAFAHAATFERGVRLANAVHRLWYLRGFLDEGRRWFSLALERAEELPELVRGKALVGSGILAWAQGDHTAAQAAYEHSLPIWERRADDKRRAAVLTNLGILALDRGDAARSRAALEESLDIYEQRRENRQAAMVRLNLADVASQEGDPDRAQALIESCRPTFEQLRDVQRLEACEQTLGKIACQRGAFDEARASLAGGLRLGRELGNRRGIAHTLTWLARTACAVRHSSAAICYLAAADAHNRSIRATIPEADRAEIERMADALRGELGETAFNLIWERASGFTDDTLEHAALNNDLFPNESERTRTRAGEQEGTR